MNRATTSWLAGHPEHVRADPGPATPQPARALPPGRTRSPWPARAGRRFGFRRGAAVVAHEAGRLVVDDLLMGVQAADHQLHLAGGLLFRLLVQLEAGVLA